MLSQEVFSSIRAEDRNVYRRFWQVTPLHAADYTFGNLLAWSEPHGLEWCVRGDLCWIRMADGNLMAPVGNWYAADWEALFDTGDAVLERVPEGLCLLLQSRLGSKRVTIQKSRGQWEYLYGRNDLAYLPGRRYHRKKNLLNMFEKRYGMRYEPLTMENLAEAESLQAMWMEANSGAENLQDLEEENRAIMKLLHSWEYLPELFGGILYAGDTPAAYSIGEYLSADTAVVHIEKGLTAYKGSYQAVNACFARSLDPRCRYINREQDLCDDGLRKAKESYAPVGFVRKNRVRINGIKNFFTLPELTVHDI
ncbi:MAG: phosphatidylglycerol lysyltransferase domain-containing protein [Desulfovibrionaceae bacterium]|nr:phosphatidylglycerol lysyltransferase domain-containing protein [Desulfovibrionaceae bacterium]